MSIATQSPAPAGNHPPAAYMPLENEYSDIVGFSGFILSVAWGGGPAPHVYAVNAIVAAAARPEVWGALAEAAIAGLCFRCMSEDQTAYLLHVHAEAAIMRNAHLLVWTHAPVLDLWCAGCSGMPSS